MHTNMARFCSTNAVWQPKRPGPTERTDDVLDDPDRTHAIMTDRISCRAARQYGYPDPFIDYPSSAYASRNRRKIVLSSPPIGFLE